MKRNNNSSLTPPISRARARPYISRARAYSATATDDLQWSRERYLKARGDLEAADLIRFDASASVVMVTRWFKHNPPMNEDHFTGIVRILERLPSETLAEEAIEALKEAYDAIRAEKIARGLRKSKPFQGALEGSQGHSSYIAAHLARKG